MTIILWSSLLKVCIIGPQNYHALSYCVLYNTTNKLIKNGRFNISLVTSGFIAHAYMYTMGGPWSMEEASIPIDNF